MLSGFSPTPLLQGVSVLFLMKQKPPYLTGDAMQPIFHARGPRNNKQLGLHSTPMLQISFTAERAKETCSQGPCQAEAGELSGLQVQLKVLSHRLNTHQSSEWRKKDWIRECYCLAIRPQQAGKSDEDVPFLIPPPPPHQAFGTLFQFPIIYRH